MHQRAQTSIVEGTNLVYRLWMRYLARRGTTEWMVWDRETKTAARYSNRNLVRLSQGEASKLAAQLNGIGASRPDDGRVYMTIAELLHTIQFRISAVYPSRPRGLDLRIRADSDRWHAICYSSDPVRDARYMEQIRAIADDLITKIKVREN